MTTPLRLGFFFSGLLHVAVVAAFSLSSEQEIPAIDEPRPLTLRLALFKPAQATPTPPLPVEEPQPQAIAEQPPPQPPEPPMEITPPVEPLPSPVVKRVESMPPKPKPRPPVRRVSTPKPVVKKRSKTKPLKRKASESMPVETSPVSSPPVTLAAVAKPQPIKDTVEPQEKQHYLAALAARINRNKYYPLASRRRAEEGKVVVRFIVQKNGDLTDLTIVESSGSRRLDAAALKTLRRVTPFRPIPEALNRDHWAITVPIAFSLRG